MSKPKSTPSSNNPWEALFSSATRPHDATAASPAMAGGYTILLQHSLTPHSQRRSALASTMANNVDRARAKGSTASVTSSMASVTLQPSATRQNVYQGSRFGVAGPFLVRQAFEELCMRCDGAVVFVSSIGTSGMLDIDERGGLNDSDVRDYSTDGDDENDYNDGQRDNTRAIRKRRSALQKFRRNGACVDLSSDPFGWGDDEPADVGMEGFVHRCTMEKLQSIATTIRRAASIVENRQSARTGEEECNEQRRMRRPIPIVFESLTPLLHMHGAEKVGVLLKSIGRLSQSEKQSCVSPIVAPVLYESLGPSQHRYLEDIDDAMVHLNLVSNGLSGSPQHSDDANSTPILSGVMDLVRRGGGGGGSLGGKLMHHCVPLRIMRGTNAFSRDVRDGCYWILEHDENAEAGKVTQVQRKDDNAVETTPTSDVGEAAQTSGPSRPRIYLEDDDPELADYDEEDDLDDDLDL